jgi:phage terminase small subunit
MTKSKLHIQSLPALPASSTPVRVSIEIPTDPPPMNRKNRLPIKESLFVQNYVKTGDGAQSARLAGFTTKHPSAKAAQLLKRPRIARAIKPFYELLDSHRDALYKELKLREEFLNELQYETILKGIDVLTKNSQLLKGNATENVAVVDMTEQYNKLINEIKEAK